MRLTVMNRILISAVCAALCAVSAASAEQLSGDPFATPIEAAKDVIAVNFTEFAKIPDADGGEAPRLMHMVDEAGTKRLFVAAMRGAIYSVSYDGKTVTPYLDVNAANWGNPVQSNFSERGIQSIAFHPQFNKKGSPGYGKFYVYVDTTNTKPEPDVKSTASTRSHDLLLLEWTAKDPGAATYDGEGPKELLRFAKPFLNHNGGQIAFNPLAKENSGDYGLLYVGSADGGSGGDPMNLAQNLSNLFGKILRIDPLGKDSANGKYGVPKSNPFVSDNKPETLGEIYAYGLRNPQRFTFDSKDGKMYVAEIGQNQVEEISEVKAGGNLGWVKWEGSYKYVNRQVDLDAPKSEAGLIWPIVEYDHKDPLFQPVVAITGITVYRQKEIKQLANLMIFGDNPSGEIFYVNADKLPNGGQDSIRRILLKDGGEQKTLLQIVKDKAKAQGRSGNVTRADLRFGFDSKGQIYVMNKRDGIIRLLVPDGK